MITRMKECACCQELFDDDDIEASGMCVACACERGCLICGTREGAIRFGEDLQRMGRTIQYTVIPL